MQKVVYKKMSFLRKCVRMIEFPLSGPKVITIIIGFILIFGITGMLINTDPIILVVSILPIVVLSVLIFILGKG